MESNIRKWFRLTVVCIVIISVLFPLIFYFTHFNYGLSSNVDNWSSFSSFWGTFIALGNAAAIIFLTFVFQNYEAERKEIIERPILGLKWNGKSYDIINIGRGPALNIRAFAASSNDLASNKFTSKYHCYSLESNGVFSANWLNGGMILIEYTDIFNSIYYTMMEGNHLYIFNEKHEPLLKSKQTDLAQAITDFKKYITFDQSNLLMP